LSQERPGGKSVEKESRRARNYLRWGGMQRLARFKIRKLTFEKGVTGGGGGGGRLWRNLEEKKTRDFRPNLKGAFCVSFNYSPSTRIGVAKQTDRG